MVQVVSGKADKKPDSHEHALQAYSNGQEVPYRCAAALRATTPLPSSHCGFMQHHCLLQEQCAIVTECRTQLSKLRLLSNLLQHAAQIVPCLSTAK
jgi:hypothetical protein